MHSWPLIALLCVRSIKGLPGDLKALPLNEELGPWLNVLTKILSAKITTWMGRIFMYEFGHHGCKSSDCSGSIHSIEAPDIPHPGEAVRYIWESFRVLGTWATLLSLTFSSPLSACLSVLQLRMAIWNLPFEITTPPNKTNKQQQQNRSLPASSLLRWQHGEKVVRISITRLPTLPSKG